MMKLSPGIGKPLCLRSGQPLCCDDWRVGIARKSRRDDAHEFDLHGDYGSVEPLHDQEECDARACDGPGWGW